MYTYQTHFPILLCLELSPKNKKLKLKFKKILICELGTRMHVFNPSAWEQNQVGLLLRG